MRRLDSHFWWEKYFFERFMNTTHKFRIGFYKSVNDITSKKEIIFFNQFNIINLTYQLLHPHNLYNIAENYYVIFKKSVNSLRLFIAAYSLSINMNNR